MKYFERKRKNFCSTKNDDIQNSASYLLLFLYSFYRASTSPGNDNILLKSEEHSVDKKNVPHSSAFTSPDRQVLFSFPAERSVDI